MPAANHPKPQWPHLRNGEKSIATLKAAERAQGDGDAQRWGGVSKHYLSQPLHDCLYAAFGDQTNMLAGHGGTFKPWAR